MWGRGDLLGRAPVAYPGTSVGGKGRASLRSVAARPLAADREPPGSVVDCPTEEITPVWVPRVAVR
jgi:hypothetical protein